MQRLPGKHVLHCNLQDATWMVDTVTPCIIIHCCHALFMHVLPVMGKQLAEICSVFLWKHKWHAYIVMAANNRYQKEP